MYAAPDNRRKASSNIKDKYNHNQTLSDNLAVC